MMLKNALLNLFRRFGVEVRRYHPNNSEHSATHLLLRYLHVDLILDVGANEGQYAESLVQGGYRGQILSFEPLSRAHASLTARSARYARWAVHPRAAVGDSTGVATIHVAGNSVSSSLLPTLKAHLAAAPESAPVGEEVVDVVRLDDAAGPYLDSATATLLKVDTQGFEWQVLNGAPHVLQTAVAVQLELSLVPLYENQKLWLEYLERLSELHFNLFFAYPAFTDDRTGQTLQWDAMFVRRFSAASPSAIRS
jgi:FkbM family methyltransferase